MLKGARHVIPAEAVGRMTPCQYGGQTETPTGATQRPPLARVQPPEGQGGTRAQTTPAVVVAGEICSNGPVGQAVVPTGA